MDLLQRRIWICYVLQGLRRKDCIKSSCREGQPYQVRYILRLSSYQVAQGMGAPTGLDVEGDHGEPAAFQQKCHLTKPAPPVQDPPLAHNRCNLVRLPAVPLNAGAIVKMMDQAAFLMPDQQPRNPG